MINDLLEQCEAGVNIKHSTIVPQMNSKVKLTVKSEKDCKRNSETRPLSGVYIKHTPAMLVISAWSRTMREPLL